MMEQAMQSQIDGGLDLQQQLYDHLEETDVDTLKEELENLKFNKENSQWDNHYVDRNIKLYENAIELKENDSMF